jgi:hypothetical protein
MKLLCCRETEAVDCIHQNRWFARIRGYPDLHWAPSAGFYNPKHCCQRVRSPAGQTTQQTYLILETT